MATLAAVVSLLFCVRVRFFTYCSLVYRAGK
jgi:hypothetical protein